MSNRLKGRVAVVTGGGRGIGRAIAVGLAEEGAAVVVNDLGTAPDGSGSSPEPAEETAAAIRNMGGQAITHAGSVADYGAAADLVETAVRELGRIDVLVNNAGILRDRMFFQMSEEEWDSVLAVHLKGSFNCARHASVRMREQKHGRIINMTSTSGLYGRTGQANYAAAKDAVAALTRNISRDLGRYGITVNAIAPAATTRLAESFSETGRAARERAGVAGFGEEARELLPRTERSSEDIAPLAVYLATDAAANINGQTFVAAGGVISLLNYPAPVRTLHKQSRWTPEEIAALFPSTLGLEMFNPAPPKKE